MEKYIEISVEKQNIKEIIGDIYNIFSDFSKSDINNLLDIYKINLILKDRVKDNASEETIYHEVIYKSFFQKINLGLKKVNIYERTFFLDNKNNFYEKLNKNQKIIYNCINTTQSNGYNREKSLKYIIKLKYNFIPYFVLNLLGGHVIEIQQTIYKNIEIIKNNIFYDFINNNPEFIKLLIGRISSNYSKIKFDTSIKNKYGRYNRIISKKDYLGFKILKELGINIRNK